MNTRSQGRLYFLALCIMGVSGIATADEAGCRNKAAASVDVEGGGSGQISASDHATNAQKRFDSMDTDRDGKVTAAEIGGSHGAERIAWAGKSLSTTDKIKAFDRNKDGSLSPKEYADGSQAMFDQLDTNADGYLEADETGVMGRMSARDAD